MKVFKRLMQIDYPRDEGGDLQAMVHPDLQNKDFTELLQQHSIRRTHSAPNTPQNNARAEAVWNHLVKKQKALQVNAELPEKWWEWAMGFACYVTNRVPSSAHGRPIK